MSNMLTNKDYNKGFNDGVRHGANKARETVAVEFMTRLQALRGEKGIGPKTWEKIVDALDVNQNANK